MIPPWLWHWIPHHHEHKPYFSGGDKGVDRCPKCHKIFFWIIDGNIGVTFSFEGRGKTIKEKNRWWNDLRDPKSLE